MNTVRSVGYGWGILIVAGAGSYYFAKRSVNSDRAERAEAEEKRRQVRERMRVQELAASRAAAANATKAKASVTPGDIPSPSRSGYDDPAPIAHKAAVAVDKGQYEAAEPFRMSPDDGNTISMGSFMGRSEYDHEIEAWTEVEAVAAHPMLYAVRNPDPLLPLTRSRARQREARDADMPDLSRVMHHGKIMDVSSGREREIFLEMEDCVGSCAKTIRIRKANGLYFHSSPPGL
nr:hypothetical protein CFP56_30691 [Quercus suber]